MAIALTHAKSATAAAARAAARDTSSDAAASDQALINRIAGGDQLAMRTLYARHRIPLYRWLLRIVGNETVAEDFLSDVFLDVWPSGRIVRGPRVGFDLAVCDRPVQGFVGAPRAGHGAFHDPIRYRGHAV